MTISLDMTSVEFRLNFNADFLEIEGKECTYITYYKEPSRFYRETIMNYGGIVPDDHIKISGVL